jgi:hypothetical protein
VRDEQQQWVREKRNGDFLPIDFLHIDHKRREELLEYCSTKRSAETLQTVGTAQLLNKLLTEFLFIWT